MDKIVNFEANMEHTVSEVICVKCLKRWICVRPSSVLLKDIECTCGNTGYVIETGQDLDARKENKNNEEK